ncbi:transcription factor grauzone [Drosophila novamexicana]|uniref:transcription factor grauzone n=1 Tax=Drosophila novamexicana TaxID=47314 RepID=UPI0011E5E6E0|nr:transcription factor grauzone [Drosophila novamexicana]
MICRLCLSDLDNAMSICIFSDAEHGLPKAIAKYLQLEVTISDSISTKLCTSCWHHLSDFQQFCAMVADKQQSLQLKMEPEPPPEPAVVVWNTESPIETKLVFDDDVKDHILCEPEIDVNDSTQSTSSSSSSNSEDSPADAFDSECEQTAAAKQSRRRTRQTPLKPAASKCPAPQLTAASQRESRLRSRELRRTAAAAAGAGAAELPAKMLKITKSRGRPKGVNAKPKPQPQPKSAKPDADELAAKRSSIKEMDDYIAANVKLDCCLCAAPLQNFIELKRHFRAEHNCTGYMECCNNRYKKRTLYVDHLHYHKDPQYFSCQPCRKSFLNRNSQDMHMLRFHSEQQQLVHQCGICEARFAKKFLLTMHIKGHKGTERTEACETCAKSFRTKLELTAHIKRMHTSDFTPVICDICGVHFRSKANFLIHKKALHPDGPVAEVQCNLCSRWLRDERSLRKHLARHDDRDGDNKYRCLLCSAEKASRVALSSHMRYHHSAKRHSCTLCGKEFKLPRALAEHMATHTGIDLYSCPFCTRTFKSHANMHNHKKKMHPNEWVRKYTQPSARAAQANGKEEQQEEPLAQPAEAPPAEAPPAEAPPAADGSYEYMVNGSAVCPI